MTTATLADLHRLVVRDDHKGALACATRLIAAGDSSVEVKHTRVVSALNLDMLHLALDACKGDDALALHAAYATYKLERESDVLSSLDGMISAGGEEGSTALALRAQALYKLGAYSSSCEAFRALERSLVAEGADEADICDARTNVMAAAAADGAAASAALVNETGSFAADAAAALARGARAGLGAESASPEFAFNLACTLAAAGDASGAAAACAASLEMSNEAAAARGASAAEASEDTTGQRGLAAMLLLGARYDEAARAILAADAGAGSGRRRRAKPAAGGSEGAAADGLSAAVAAANLTFVGAAASRDTAEALQRLDALVARAAAAGARRATKAQVATFKFVRATLLSRLRRSSEALAELAHARLAASRDEGGRGEGGAAPGTAVGEARDAADALSAALSAPRPAPCSPTDAAVLLADARAAVAHAGAATAVWRGGVDLAAAARLEAASRVAGNARAVGIALATALAERRDADDAAQATRGLAHMPPAAVSAFAAQCLWDGDDAAGAESLLRATAMAAAAAAAAVSAAEGAASRSSAVATDVALRAAADLAGYAAARGDAAGAVAGWRALIALPSLPPAAAAAAKACLVVALAKSGGSGGGASDSVAELRAALSAAQALVPSEEHRLGAEASASLPLNEAAIDALENIGAVGGGSASGAIAAAAAAAASDTAVAALAVAAQRRHRRVLARRAKARDLFLETLGQKQAPAPEPERWLPKHLRTVKRTGRSGRSKTRTAASSTLLQGSVADASETAALDVRSIALARAAAAAAATDADLAAERRDKEAAEKAARIEIARSAVKANASRKGPKAREQASPEPK